MSRSRLLFFALSSVLVFLVIAGGLTAATQEEEEGEESLYKMLSVFTEVLGLTRKAYVDPVDLETLMEGALDGATEALDPFSFYLPAGHFEEYLAAREIGDRRSGLILLKDRGIAYAAAVVPGSPAEAAGIQTGDVVAELEGRETRGMPLWQIQNLLAGPVGSEVEALVIRREERVPVTLELAEFEPPRPALEPFRDAHVLRVGGFGRDDVPALRKALAEAGESGVENLLVDLRGVAGGDPEAAYAVAGFFTRGTLGTLERRGEELEAFTSEDEPLWQGDLVVLTNRGTLGAAEILATVLRQKAGAELVGEPTFGYAGRLAVARLASGARLVYSDAFYTGPEGEILRERLEPDLRVSEASRRFGEKDVPLQELILERGFERLMEEEADETEAVAA